MARHSVRVLCAAALVLALCGAPPRLPAAHAADPAAADRSSPSADLAIWDPSESWPGGSQADARLDQPLAFWRAGLSLEEVFSAVQDQTGVTIEFSPPDDVNRRVRVNLFLNRDDPPSLRDVMAQLSWVAECSFASADNPQGRVYSLLSTSRGRDIQDDVTGGQEDLREYWADWRERHRAHSIARIKVYVQALRLPRDQLIARYRGVDDYLLYTLLNPARRAAVQLWCDLPEEDQLALLREEREIARDWADFDPPERARMVQVFDLTDAALDLDRVRITISSDGLMSHFTLLQEREDRDRDDWQWIGGVAWGWSAECELSPKEEIALRRLLGERISADREQAYVQQRTAEIKAKRRAAWQADQDRRRTQDRSLSPAMEELLSSAALTSCRPQPYGLWEIQQMVAEAASVSIVSDSFCDLPRLPREPDRHSALGVLSAACQTQRPRPRQEMLGDWTDSTVEDCLAWEWGDAGRILRFRSTHRDLWRAALLPPEALALLDRWIAPYLEPDSLADRQSIQVPVDLDGILWLASHLDTTQARFGGLLTYGDPADDTESWTCGFRQWATAAVSWNLIWKLLSTFSREQWDMLRDGGVRFDRDLSPSQLELAREAFPRLGQNATLEGDVTDYTMRIAEGDVAPPYAASPPRDYHFEFLADGKVMAERGAPTTVLAYPVWPQPADAPAPPGPASPTD
jgi:hypothetical protein